VGDSCEHGNAASSYMRDGGLLDQLTDCQLLKKDSSP
jgi:hypothetical protein